MRFELPLTDDEVKDEFTSDYRDEGAPVGELPDQPQRIFVLQVGPRWVLIVCRVTRFGKEHKQERYVWITFDRDLIFSSLWQMASNPELGLTWLDAAMSSKAMREMA